MWREWLAERFEEHRTRLRAVAIDFLADPERLSRIDLSILDKVAGRRGGYSGRWHTTSTLLPSGSRT
jgi:hypothetical protein